MKRNFHGNPLAVITYITRCRRAGIVSALPQYDFPGPIYDIAMCISKNPGISQDGVADKTRYDKATIARDAQKLEKGGYLRRESCTADRRQYELYLTGSGMKLAEDAFRAEKEWADVLLKDFSPEERESFYSLLCRAADTIE